MILFVFYAFCICILWFVFVIYDFICILWFLYLYFMILFVFYDLYLYFMILFVFYAFCICILWFYLYFMICICISILCFLYFYFKIFTCILYFMILFVFVFYDSYLCLIICILLVKVLKMRPYIQKRGKSLLYFSSINVNCLFIYSPMNRLVQSLNSPNFHHKTPTQVQVIRHTTMTLKPILHTHR
jgi:hypothetical protein